jgi:hypothetical protein
MMDGKYDINMVVNQIHTSIPESALKVKKVLSQRAHVSLLEFDSNVISVAQVIERISMDERAAFVQPNHTNIKSRTTIPNDLEYPIQWSVGPTATARIFAPEAWDISTDGITATGDTIVVAVVDGGMDLNHIDLNLFKNKHEIPLNGIDDDNNGYIDDYDGWSAYTSTGVIGNDDHGTHIAGTICARTNNSEGVAGIIWGGKVIPINASSSNESVVIEGYGYALELRATYNETNGDSGAFIVATNSSFGVDRGDPDNYPIWCAFYDSLGAAGILNMAATSNSSLDVDIRGDIPTTCPSNYMVAVSNVNQNGNILGGYGATEIDLAAPGTDIRSTMPNQRYGYKTGTSMATPHVAGVVGAMYSAMCGFDLVDALENPDSLSIWVRNRLLESVDTVPNLANKNITSGRLNMFKALQSVQTETVQMSYNRTPATNATSADGSITINAQGGTNPLTYSWNTGETTATINNLNPGIYAVTVTETFGCTAMEDVDIWTVGINELDQSMIQVKPNPNKGSFSLRFSTPLPRNSKLEIWDTLGKLVYTSSVSEFTNEISISLQNTPGLYFLRVGNSDVIRFIQR